MLPSGRQKPVITVEGAGKEINGVDSNAVFNQEFIPKLRPDLEKSGFVLKMDPKPGSDNSLKFKLTIEFAEGT